MITLLLLSFFIIELVLLFFISRISINDLFQFFYRFTRNEKVVFSIISFIFFPGTIVHELSHFFMAVFLFLNVRDFKVFPEWEKNYIKLGSVVYEKKDVFRSILVGIAPIIVGLSLFWLISFFKPFSHPNLVIKVGMLYAIFILSSTMFSSKQDLVDIIYIVPLFAVIALFIYIFQINIISLLESAPKVVEGINNFLYAIISYIGVALGVHIFFIAFSRLSRRIR